MPIDPDALYLVNEIKTQLVHLTRRMVRALDDGKVTPTEGVSLGMEGMQFATTVVSLLEDSDAALRHDLLTVLDQGTFSIPDGA